MKRVYFVALALLFCTFASRAEANGFTKGTPDFKSMGVMAFSSNGILFIGDSQGGAIFALDLGDNIENTEANELRVQNIDQQIAELVGGNAKQVRIHDLAVNPVSQNSYLTVSRGAGKNTANLLLKVTASGNLQEVILENVSFMKKSISNPISMEKKTHRGQSLRTDAITDLAFSEGELIVAGLSNEEFSSTLRVISFPFDDTEKVTSLEMYHAAHKRYETNSPIRTLLAYELEKTPHVLAAYTCTPLVSFPITKMKDGGHLKGKTVGEFGSNNRPLDMISYQNNGKDFILLANSARTLMKVDPLNIEKQTAVTEPVMERYGTSGVDFIAVPQVGVQQLSNFNSKFVIVIQRAGNGSLNLQTLPVQRL